MNTLVTSKIVVAKCFWNVKLYIIRKFEEMKLKKEKEKKQRNKKKIPKKKLTKEKQGNIYREAGLSLGRRLLIEGKTMSLFFFINMFRTISLKCSEVPIELRIFNVQNYH